MKRRSVERILSLREHAEREKRASLAQSVQELRRRLEAKDELLECRRQEESEVTTGVADSDTLRRQHAHLFKLALDLENLETRMREIEAELAERELAWLESRRSVKSLEALLARHDAATASAERRRYQKLLDSLALRKRHTPPGQP